MSTKQAEGEGGGGWGGGLEWGCCDMGWSETLYYR